MNFYDSIKKNDFLVTTQLESCCPDDVFNAIKTANSFNGLVNAIVVSDEQQFNSKIGSIVICHLLRDVGIDPIPHISCVEKNKKYLETFILNSWIMGIKFLCVTSEKPVHKKGRTEPPGTTEITALQLINLIKRLEEGRDFSNKAIKEKPSFTIGTILDLANEDAEDYKQTVRNKISAGIKFIITTPVYNVRQLENLNKYVEGTGVKVIAGIKPINSVESAKEINRFHHEKVITAETIERLEKSKNPAIDGIHIAAELIEQIKNKVNGIHLITLKNYITKILKLTDIHQNPSMSALKDEKDILRLDQIFEGKLSIKELEKAYIIRVLKNNKGNKCTSAEVLGIHRNTLMRKCEEYNINI